MKRKRRKRNKGKSKGSNFERLICRLLSEWWTHGQDDCVFWRSTSSGARATTRKKSGKKTHGQDGDITALHPCGADLMDLVTIETKCGYKGVSLSDFLDMPKNKKLHELESWIEQVHGSHINAGSFAWWLIFKRDRREPIVLMPEYLADLLQLYRIAPQLVRITTPVYDERLAAVPLAFLLANTTPKTIRKLCKEN